jgi:hypothetical protein
MNLVTLDQAKAHLRIDGMDSDVEVGEMVFNASAIIMDYLKREVPAAWNVPTEAAAVPGVIRAATLMVVGELFKMRETGGDPLSPAVMNLLTRQRDPALK